MIRTLLIAGLVVGAMAATGCSTGDDDTGGSSSWQQALGCTSTAEQETEELYVLALYSCTKPDGSTTDVYTFKDDAAKTSWNQIASGLGGVVLTEGDTWLEVKP